MNGHGGKREGAGRKKKVVLQQNETINNPIEKPIEETSLEVEAMEQTPVSLENSLKQLLQQRNKDQIDPIMIQKLVHEVAYLRHEVEFIKKIIMVSVGGTSK